MHRRPGYPVVFYAALVCVFAWDSHAATPLMPQNDGRIVRVRTQTLPKSGFDCRADSLVDYGSFVWAELTPAEFASLEASGAEFEEYTDAYTLRLGERSFDPAVSIPAVAAGWDKGQGDAGPDLHLVQLIGPSRASWLDALEAGGLEIVQYIPPHTYVVWGERGARDAGSVLEGIRWVGDFLPAYRVMPRWRSLGDQPTDVQIILYRGADVDSAVREITGLGGKLSGRTVLNDKFEIARVSMSGASLQAASQLPGVYSIQLVPTDGGLRGEMSSQVNVNNVSGSNQAFPGYEAWLAGVGLSGAGVVIANVDSGVQDTHPDLVNRMRSCSGTTCGGLAISGHGSHTAGIMAADGSSGTLDAYGFLRGLGVAPGANLIEQVYSPYFQQANGMLLLMKDSYRNGASLSGNSWGPAGSPRGYDNDTMQVDIGVRDADSGTPGNQPLSYVLSIMNGYGGTSTQGTPDEAKNIFTIGSTKMQLASGQQYLDIDNLSYNSAHGPALDGRTIPHMVAPGCYVDSSGTGTGYYLECGTSMASPQVTGAVAVFIEYYRSLSNPPADPSPAMVKAAFTAVARDLAGNHDASGGVMGHPFDSKQGWGRMDLEAVLDPTESVLYFDNPVVFDNTGEEWAEVLSVDDPGKPVRLMLVWTDAPGHGLGGSTPAWNNDLDLVVEVGPATYKGNNFAGTGWSQSGGSADNRNNTEGVFLAPTSPDTFTIRVIASNINSDAIPGVGDTTDQDFAMVCYNCIRDAGFALNATPDARDICAPDDAVYSVSVEQILGFADPVTLSVSGEPAGTTVTFDPNPVTPPGTSELTIGNTGAAPPGSYTIAIEGVAPTSTRATSVELSIADGVPGSATLVAPPDGATDVSLVPVFSWAGASQADTYTIEVANDGAFSDIVATASGLTDTAYTTLVTLEPSRQYFWHIRAANACGSGSYSAAFSFTTRDTPSVLLVDDDDNNPDVRSYYTNALDSLGQAYEVWDTNNSNVEPDAAVLSQYKTVIWFSGVEFGGAAGPGSAGEAALASFLDAGNCLFISSQDYYYDRGLTGFMSGYLGVDVASSDVGQTNVTGAGSVFGEMGSYSLTYPFSNYSDLIVPRSGVETAFTGDQGSAAVLKETSVYRTTFWGFPLEAIPSADRRALLGTVLDWCESGSPAQSPQPLTLPADPQHRALKHRYLSIDTTSNPDREVVLKVEIVSMKRCAVDSRRACIVDGDCGGVCDNDHDVTCTTGAQCSEGLCVIAGPCVEHSDVGMSWFVQAPEQNPEGCLEPGCDSETQNCCGADDWIARVDPIEHSEVWSLETLHIGDCEIAPVITYAVYACLPQGGACSDPLLVPTQRMPLIGPETRINYGDFVGPVNDETFEFDPPDGFVNVHDVSGFVLTKKNYGTTTSPQVHPTWMDAHGLGLGNPPNYILSVSDLQQVLFSFLGLPWNNASGNLQPSECNARFARPRPVRARW